jgi:hypothetical protein
MNRMKEEIPEDDEFEPIELGTALEETKGVDEGSGESSSGTQNTRL